MLFTCYKLKGLSNCTIGENGAEGVLLFSVAEETAQKELDGWPLKRTDKLLATTTNSRLDLCVVFASSETKNPAFLF